MAQPPSPYTFNHNHLRQLEERARKATTDEEGRALAAELTGKGHIERATYNPTMRRVDVVLYAAPHQNALAFPLPLGDPPATVATGVPTLTREEVALTPLSPAVAVRM
jgi:hypothetical protein